MGRISNDLRRLAAAVTPESRYVTQVRSPALAKAGTSSAVQAAATPPSRVHAIHRRGGWSPLLQRKLTVGRPDGTPDSERGRRLLAHELTRVVQQGGGDSVLQRVPASGPAPRRNQWGTTLPYREATELVECVRIMGEENAAYCRREVLGEEAGSAAAPSTPAPRGAADAAKKGSKKVCLTFDDGPQKGTEDVLNALAGTIPAAFFLTGANMASNAAEQKRLVERMLGEGHQIANHTFTHDPETTKGYEKAYGDLSDPANLKKFQDNYEKNEEHFRKLLGSGSPVFTSARLPGNGRFVKVGDKLIYVVATEGTGMAHVTWHFEFGTNGSFGHLKALDWKGIKGAAAEVERFPGPNDIVLLHDRHWSGKRALLEEIFNKLSTNSFAFGKLDATGKCA